MFINKILTNAEIWYGIKENELGDFEDLDRYLIRKAFQCPPRTWPSPYWLHSEMQAIELFALYCEI